MAFFGKSINDEEWLCQAKPLYSALVPLVRRLNDAVLKESLQDEMICVWDACNKLLTIAQGIKRIPRPTSATARLADEKLKSATKMYAIAMKDGRQLLDDLQNPDRSLNGEDATECWETGNDAYEKESFEGLIRSAQNEMKEVDAYFSTR